MNGAYDMILSQTGLSGITIIAVTLLTAVMVYLLLPTLVCQWDPRFKQAVRSNNRVDLKMEKKRKISVWIGQLINKQKRQLILAGFDQTRFHTLYLVSLGLVAVIGLFVSLCVNIKAAPLLLAVFVISQSNLMIHRRAKVRMKHFARGSYKIYRFIHEQVSSGISLPDGGIALCSNLHIIAGGNKPYAFDFGVDLGRRFGSCPDYFSVSNAL